MLRGALVLLLLLLPHVPVATSPDVSLVKEDVTAVVGFNVTYPRYVRQFAVFNSTKVGGVNLLAVLSLDADGDGLNEILAGGDDGSIYLVDPVNRSIREVLRLGGRIRSLVTGDFDGDGEDEIAVGSTREVVYFLSGDLEIERVWPSAGAVSGPLVLCPINYDSDAADELAVSTSDRLYVIDFSPETCDFTVDYEEPSEGIHILACGDLDSDGLPELCVATQGSPVVRVLKTDGVTFYEVRGTEVIAPEPVNSIAVGLINGTTCLITFGGSYVRAYLWTEGNATELWLYSLNGTHAAGVALTWENSTIIVAVARHVEHEYLVYVFNGTRLMSRFTHHAYSGVFDSICLADVDGDGRPEVVLGDVDGELSVYELNGTQVFSGEVIGENAYGLTTRWNLTILAGEDGKVHVRSDPLGPDMWCFDAGSRVYAVKLADLDGDGSPELAVGAESVVRIYDLTRHSIEPNATFVAVEPWRMDVADLDADGLEELVYASAGAGYSTISVIDFNQTYLTLCERRVAGKVIALAATDWTGDTVPELVVVSTQLNLTIIYVFELNASARALEVLRDTVIRNASRSAYVDQTSVWLSLENGTVVRLNSSLDVVWRKDIRPLDALAPLDLDGDGELEILASAGELVVYDVDDNVSWSYQMLRPMLYSGLVMTGEYLLVGDARGRVFTLTDLDPPNVTLVVRRVNTTAFELTWSANDSDVSRYVLVLWRRRPLSPHLMRRAITLPANASRVVLNLTEGEWVARLYVLDSSNNSWYAEAHLWVDLVRPSINVVAPENGSFVARHVLIVADLADNLLLAYYRIKVNDLTVVDWTPLMTNESHIELTIPLTRSENVVVLEVIDWGGNVARAILALRTDVTPPEIVSITPENGSIVNGTIVLSVEVRDDTGVSNVSFYIDGQLIAVVSAPPYAVLIDTTRLQDGPHVLRVEVRDGCGNVAVREITIIVKNYAPKRPQRRPTPPWFFVLLAAVITAVALLVWAVRRRRKRASAPGGI